MDNGLWCGDTSSLGSAGRLAGPWGHIRVPPGRSGPRERTRAHPSLGVVTEISAGTPQSLEAAPGPRRAPAALYRERELMYPYGYYSRCNTKKRRIS
ncbi:hypothetical protein EVAR_39498_1 [Eumeta japonica]|uniref:Uncharacterized protein n=1 Tax=Eumeta variegata TaxID=151549 RepID=A0A4C1VZL7_EUMVA|nr:hypothetical protein EVAR_39498_1 [Eumeta japonica]